LALRSSSLLVSSRSRHPGCHGTLSHDAADDRDAHPPAQLPTTAPTIAPTIPGEDIRPETSEGDGDHDRFAHYCRREDVMRAYVTGEAIEALCGKKWVPTRDPSATPCVPPASSAGGGWQL